MVTPQREAVALDELVPRALRGLPPEHFVLRVPDTLPVVSVDAGLLERALANIFENAVRHATSDTPVAVDAAAVNDQVVIRIADRGPGVSDARKSAVFQAFQRLGDAPAGQGLGLGLAVARGFVEANGGSLDAEDTPGGGLTLVIALPQALAQEQSWPES